LDQLGLLLGFGLGIHSAQLQRKLFGGHIDEGPQVQVSQARTKHAQGEAPGGAGDNAAKQQMRLQGSRVVTIQVGLRHAQRAPRRARRQQSNANEGAASHSSGAHKVDIKVQ
jgi:hypothetical protein